MGLMDWIRGFWGSESATEDESKIMAEMSAIQGAEAEVVGLNFQTAIEAHMKWRARLEAVLHGVSSEKLEAATVAKNDQCVLGKWLYGQGKEHIHLGSFSELEQTHTHFHKSAAEILHLAQTGRKGEAPRLLAGDYRTTSVRIGGLLARLHREAKQKPS